MIHNPLGWKINKYVVFDESMYTGKNVKNLSVYTRLFGTHE